MKLSKKLMRMELKGPSSLQLLKEENPKTTVHHSEANLIKAPAQVMKTSSPPNN
jgi:hypothetical protein